MENKEIWKSVKNYENIYEVSSFGNVRSLDKLVNSKNNSKALKKGRVLKQSKNKGGYYMVNLCDKQVSEVRTVHQLVAEAFLGFERSGMKLVVDHIDNDKTNNKLCNIQIITTRQNNIKDIKNKTSKYTGVSYCKTNNKWKSYIWDGVKNIYLGSFVCELAAAYSYNKKSKEIYN